MTPESIIQETNRDVTLTIAEFRTSECMKCMKQGLQEKRGCMQSKGWDILACHKQDLYVNKKIKKNNAQRMNELFEDLLSFKSNSSKSTPENGFLTDMIN